MNQNESMGTEIISQEQCVEIFEKYHFLLIGMDKNSGCYRFIVKTTGERKDALTYNEMEELCARFCAVCIEVRSDGEKDYGWTVFYTTEI